MSPPRQRQARRAALFLMILSAALAACAIASHRLHNQATEQALRMLADAATIRAARCAAWLDAREAAFRAFAEPITLEQALQPAAAAELTAQLHIQDPAFNGLAMVNDTGRSVWGGAAPGSMHESFPWFRDAVGPTLFSGGIYPGPDASPRVWLSRRLTEQGRGWHLRAEADAGALAALMGQTGGVSWVLADEQGPVMPLAGLAPNPGLSLHLEKICRGQLPAARRLDKGWLIAAVGIPERKTALAVITPEPSTPYKHIGLGLTILAAACLAYAGHIRARALRG